MALPAWFSPQREWQHQLQGGTPGVFSSAGQPRHAPISPPRPPWQVHPTSPPPPPQQQPPSSDGGAGDVARIQESLSNLDRERGRLAEALQRAKVAQASRLAHHTAPQAAAPQISTLVGRHAAAAAAVGTPGRGPAASARRPIISPQRPVRIAGQSPDARHRSQPRGPPSPSPQEVKRQLLPDPTQRYVLRAGTAEETAAAAAEAAAASRRVGCLEGLLHVAEREAKAARERSLSRGRVGSVWPREIAAAQPASSPPSTATTTAPSGITAVGAAEPYDHDWVAMPPSVQSAPPGVRAALTAGVLQPPASTPAGGTTSAVDALRKQFPFDTTRSASPAATEPLVGTLPGGGMRGSHPAFFPPPASTPPAFYDTARLPVAAVSPPQPPQPAFLPAPHRAPQPPPSYPASPAAHINSRLERINAGAPLPISATVGSGGGLPPGNFLPPEPAGLPPPLHRNVHYGDSGVPPMNASLAPQANRLPPANPGGGVRVSPRTLPGNFVATPVRAVHYSATGPLAY
eukprot:Rhum_TRINITY_DN8362_c0_g1::Rhum_TRINITY_DN8362_c0_g1_i1::g.27151::m.27151